MLLLNERIDERIDGPGEHLLAYTMQPGLGQPRYFGVTLVDAAHSRDRCINGGRVRLHIPRHGAARPRDRHPTDRRCARNQFGVVTPVMVHSVSSGVSHGARPIQKEKLELSPIFGLPEPHAFRGKYTTNPVDNRGLTSTIGAWIATTGWGTID